MPPQSHANQDGDDSDDGVIDEHPAGLLSQGPASPLWRQFYTELSEQCRTVVPTLTGMAVSKIPWLVSLRFVGGIGAQELAAAALATSLCNVTGISLSVGLSSALTTLTGQARGERQAQYAGNKGEIVGNSGDARQRQADARMELQTLLEDDNPPQVPLKGDSETEPLLPMVYLYRGLMLQLLFVIPVGTWWLSGIKPALVALGLGDQLSAMTEQYLRVLTPGLWSYSVCWTITAWLQAIEMAHVPAYAALLVCITHIPLNLLYINVWDWGYLGCAAATTTTQTLQALYIISYISLTARGRREVLQSIFASSSSLANVGWTNHLPFWKEARIGVLSLSGIAQYLGLAVPGIVAISEWWASEVAIFLAGHMSPSPDAALAGMSLYQSINAFCFMFPAACSVAGASRVAYFLGANDPQSAALASGVSIGFAGAVSALLGIILLSTSHSFFPGLFAPGEPDVVHQASTTIPLLSVYVFADGLQTALNGSMKGCGRQVMTMPIVIVAYWVVGLPLSCYFAFVQNGGQMCTDRWLCGIVGLVAGMTVGTWIHMLLLALVVVCCTNWELEAQQAKERLSSGPITSAMDMEIVDLPRGSIMVS